MRLVRLALGLAFLAGPVLAEPSDDAVAAVGCVAAMDAIHAANFELGQTPESDPEAVRAEWMSVVGTLAPDLGSDAFDGIYADVYPEVHRIVIAFGREHLADTGERSSPGPAEVEFMQVVDLCQRTMQKALDLGMK